MQKTFTDVTDGKQVNFWNRVQNLLEEPAKTITLLRFEVWFNEKNATTNVRSGHSEKLDEPVFLRSEHF